MPATDTLIRTDDLVSDLTAIVGPDGVVTDLARRTFYSTDIAGTCEIASAVVRVADTPALVEVLKACAARGYGVIPRGGGFSYTGGYTPAAPGTVIVDMRGLDRILEVNEEDMYVVVEAGCTWRALYEALKARGLRTPYFGPMSGYRATVGGALSQGSFFLGSSEHGTAADSVLGLEVALADGTLLRTGSGGPTGVLSFFRQYGPDATGLFLSDTGAMGFKTKAVLRLIPFPKHQAYASFAFASHSEAVSALSSIGRTGMAAECYCWDPYFVRVMSASTGGFRADLAYLLNVVRAGSGLLDGLAAGARIAVAGRRAFPENTWILNVTLDDPTREGAAAKLKRLRALGLSAGGREIAATAPRTLRGTPFTDFNTQERRILRRNIPINGICPHSKVRAVADDVYALISSHADEMDRRGVSCGVIFFAVGAQAACVEPLLYWEDERHFLHDRVREVSDLEGLAGRPDAPPATELAMAIREEIKALFGRHGCVHVQVARSYPWAATRDAAHLALIRSLKAAVDPQNLVNRGSLKLDAPDAA